MSPNGSFDRKPFRGLCRCVSGEVIEPSTARMVKIGINFVCANGGEACKSQIGGSFSMINARLRIPVIHFDVCLSRAAVRLYSASRTSDRSGDIGCWV